MHRILKHSIKFLRFCRLHHNTRWRTFNGRCQCLSKFLDVIAKPESYKLKVIPIVAEYISASSERMYELIF